MIKKNKLTDIPGVGKNMAEHLIALGYNNIEDLKGEDPEKMYEIDNIRCGGNLDRCVLYVYRLAVYYAENEEYEPEKLKWWNWKY